MEMRNLPPAPQGPDLTARNYLPIKATLQKGEAKMMNHATDVSKLLNTTVPMTLGTALGAFPEEWWMKQI
jgi:hypothetical protein